MIARLKCWLFGHLRGKEVARWTLWGNSKPPTVQRVELTFECPRCHARWTRRKSIINKGEK